ncbi:hypothetical protein PMIN01_04909 [Paraphaeosphaeria minitans]|uniref:Glucose-methanol-choline oxidoreductase C-terminal domain-containing protein n=1 Tax=Paraphaeosphaeria minitans TaxID=565426 RepID=A0A9P6GLE0_9PLEO|nr:hypothetical protein PMIN01_04909 [Paraphaeosphaeria minitans]
MAPHNKGGVVQVYLRVFGVHGLRIVDASVPSRKRPAK